MSRLLDPKIIISGAVASVVAFALIEAAKDEQMDGVIALLYRFCDNLETLARTPVGKDTASAVEAQQLSAALRQCALQLSLPPGHPGLVDASKRLLALLEQTAKRHGAWPEDGGE